MFQKKLFVLFFIPLLFLLCTACRKERPLANTSSTLRISTEVEPQSLDPRRVRELANATIIHMLYEGLMRQLEVEEPSLALAEQVTLSQDQKTYTFTLRQSDWSNGQPVTAYDFERTWKSLLDPQFPSPNAYQFYVIEGAQEAKEGKASLAKVGIHAKDEKTLVVTLVRPTSYFLSLTASYFFYPVHSSVDDKKVEQADSIVTNGPFALEKWRHNNELIAVPNPHYWDKENVHLSRIEVVVLDNPTAMHLFQTGELDWTGSPLSTLSSDSLAAIKKQGILQIKPSAGIYLFRLNTERPPFTHLKMRQALALSLNRKDLIDHVLQGNQMPAMGFIPHSFGNREDFFNDHDLVKARALFTEALEELGLTRDSIPNISIQYASNERAHKIAQVAQQYWKEGLGIQVDLQGRESKVHYDRLKNHDYQVGLGSWFADIRDPISFLEVFKSKENGTNHTQWENEQYFALLEQSSASLQKAEREEILKKAEGILMQEMPMIPLFFNSYNYIKNPSVKGVYFSELGYLDFKHAYIDTTP